MKLQLKHISKISLIIDKMQLQIPSNVDKMNQNELGAWLILQIASKFHKAEKEFLELASLIFDVTPEQASEMGFDEIMKKFKDEGVIDFFKRAIREE